MRKLCELLCSLVTEVKFNFSQTLLKIQRLLKIQKTWKGLSATEKILNHTTSSVRFKLTRRLRYGIWKILSIYPPIDAVFQQLLGTQSSGQCTGTKHLLIQYLQKYQMKYLLRLHFWPVFWVCVCLSFSTRAQCYCDCTAQVGLPSDKQHICR